jgi:hypothetical protein
MPPTSPDSWRKSDITMPGATVAPGRVCDGCGSLLTDLGLLADQIGIDTGAPARLLAVMCWFLADRKRL